MDRVLTARIDPKILDELNEVTRRLGISKKRFLEEAIRLRAAQEECRPDVWAETAGAWERDESPEETIEAIRESFRKNWRRYRDLGRD
jgi:hypothetical protein